MTNILSPYEEQLLKIFPEEDLEKINSNTTLSQMLLARAIAISAYCHRNMTDKGGNPYITHPMRVMMRLRTSDPQLMSLAILHDVVEDCGISLTCLKYLGFDNDTLKYLEILSHTDDSSYEQYIERIGKYEKTTLVKLEDLRDNSNITRMKGLREKDFIRLQKYCNAYQYLTSRLETGFDL